MAKSVFVSYSHQQGAWVLERLVPLLRAGGANIIVDVERFKAGRALIGQMDIAQDGADINVLVLTPDYVTSGYCMHEMRRAVARDPAFEHGTVVPVVRADVELPIEIVLPQPIRVDLRNDMAEAQWAQCLVACDADCGSQATDWLRVRDDTLQFLRNRQSVNLIVNGQAQWRFLLKNIGEYFPPPGINYVDLESGATASRRGLVTEILRAVMGRATPVPNEPEDLVELSRVLDQKASSMFGIRHFDFVGHRHGYYGSDLYGALRHLVDARKLTLLIQSRVPFATLLPRDHPLSGFDIKTVELRGHV
jgi:hypothetical protein